MSVLLQKGGLMAKRKIPLAEMIVEPVELRTALLDAQHKGKNEDLKFSIDDIELELQFTASKEGGTEGGVNFWVYNASASGKMASETVHTLRFKLKPETAPGGSVKLSRRSKRPSDR